MFICPILHEFYLEDYSTKSINKKSYREHKTLVLTVVVLLRDLVELSLSKTWTTIGQNKHMLSLVVQVRFLNKKMCELYIFNLID